MKYFIIAILITIQINPCFSADTKLTTLRFLPKIQNESLAEESIMLLECIEKRSGSNWELANDEKDLGDHWLQLSQTPTKPEAEGVFFENEKEYKFILKTGEASKICEQISPHKVVPAEPTSLNIPSGYTETEMSPKSSNKLLLGIAAAAVIIGGGYLIWKSQQPDFRSMKME